MPNSKAPTTNVEAMARRHGGCLAVLGTLILTIALLQAMCRVMQVLYINAAYGRAAWDEGLRVIDNPARLSNGEPLSRWDHTFITVGSFLLTIPFFLGSGYGLTYLSMKLHGESLN